MRERCRGRPDLGRAMGTPATDGVDSEPFATHASNPKHHRTGGESYQLCRAPLHFVSSAWQAHAARISGASESRPHPRDG